MSPQTQYWYSSELFEGLDWLWLASENEEHYCCNLHWLEWSPRYDGRLFSAVIVNATSGAPGRQSPSCPHYKSEIYGGGAWLRHFAAFGICAKDAMGGHAQLKVA